MSDNTPKKSSFPISKIFRYGGFGILLLMLVLSLIYQASNPNMSDEERIEATVQAGVDQGLTQVAAQTGTPDPTAIQMTVEAGIDATLTALVELSATPDPNDPNAPESSPLEPATNFLSNLFAPIMGILQGMWNFAGVGGIVVQVLCCIVPPLLIVVGIVND